MALAAAAVGQDPSREAVEFERALAIIGRGAGSSPAGSSQVPALIRDRQGTVWAAWEKWESDRARVELASFGPAGLESSRTVGANEGFDLSPDLAEPPAGAPWVAWINTLGPESRVLVLDTSTDSVWVLAEEPSGSLAGPRIVFDAEGSAWVFWNTASGPTGEIAYRVFRRGGWTAEAVVPRGTDWPACSPDAAVDVRGTVWLAWSGYDGRGHGIYLSSWSGSGWTPAACVSGHPGANLFPSLAFEPDGSPVVSWTRMSEDGRLACFSGTRNGTAGPEIQFKAPFAPRLIQGSGGPAVALNPGPLARVLALPEALASGRSAPAATASPALLPLLGDLPLDENKYAGFGDSITFGYLDWYSHPERGYIPRLEAILNTAYGSQRVVNEGFGGEVTAEGLARIGKVFIADRPRYILIMEGTNDVIFTDISISSAAFNLEQMVRKCLAAGVFPVIATIIPRLDWFGGQTLFRDRLLLLNIRIRQIAANTAVPLVDMYAAFNAYPAASGGVLSLLSTDLKHPSDKGYQHMAATWFSAIQKFPFPPVNLSLTTLVPERTAPERVWARPEAEPRTPREPAADPRLPLGTLLTWAHNPKIFDPAVIMGYRLYRRPSGDSTKPFALFAFVEQPLAYLQRGMTASGLYDYALSAVRKDGIEGPLSDPVGR